MHWTMVSDALTAGDTQPECSLVVGNFKDGLVVLYDNGCDHTTRWNAKSSEEEVIRGPPWVLYTLAFHQRFSRLAGVSTGGV
jgi:hypothetical protein